MVILRYGTKRASYREGFHGKLHHRRKTLVRQLSQAGEKTPVHGVESDRDGEHLVQKVHCSVLVEHNQTLTLEPQYWINPGGEVDQKEGSPRPACLSINSVPPSNQTVWNRQDRASSSSPGKQLFPINRTHL